MKNSNKAPSKVTLKKVLTLIAIFTISLAVYKLILELGERIDFMFYYVGISLYLAAASILFCIYYFKNDFKLGTAPTPASELPRDWSDEEKKEFLAREAARKESAKKILYVLLPMVVTIFINYIEVTLPSFLDSLGIGAVIEKFLG